MVNLDYIMENAILISQNREVKKRKNINFWNYYGMICPQKQVQKVI